MATNRVLTQSFFIQSFGAGLSFLVAVIVAQRFGPAAQGTFATARAWVDMASLVMLAGLPQALMHEVSSGRLSGQLATRLALTYAIVGSVVLWGSTAVVGPLNPPFPDAYDRTILLLAACLATVHGLMRVLVLTSRRYLSYNLISAAPSALLVLGVIIISIADTRQLALVLVVVFGTCSLLAIVGVRDLLFTRVPEPLIPGKVLPLVQYGAWSFAQQTAAQGAVLGSYMFLRGHSDDAVGYFSVAMVLVSVITLPLNVIGPILFNRWVEEYASNGCADQFLSATCGFLMLGIVATIIGLPLVYVGVPYVFGEEFAPALPAYLTIAASTLFLIQRRVLSTASLAFGMPRYCAIAEALRAAVTLTMVASYPTLEGAIAAWCVGEFVGLVLLIVALKKRLGVSYRRVIGADRGVAGQLLQLAFRRRSTR